jgi:hypothetical protein
MLCDTYQGGTVAAATPQRVGNMDPALLPVTCSFDECFSRSVRAGLAFSEKPIHRLPLKREMKDQSHEK